MVTVLKLLALQNPVVKVKVKVILIWKVLPHTEMIAEEGLFSILKMAQSAPCTELNNTDFESAVWRIITLNKRDKLLVGCIYKNMGSTEQNSLMNKAVKKHGIYHLLIFGDFNFPEINWKSCLLKGSDHSLPVIFLCNTGFIPETTC